MQPSVSVVHPATLLNQLFSCLDSLEFSTCKRRCHLGTEIILPLPFQFGYFLSFSCPISLGHSADLVVRRVWEHTRLLSSPNSHPSLREGRMAERSSGRRVFRAGQPGARAAGGNAFRRGPRAEAASAAATREARRSAGASTRRPGLAGCFPPRPPPLPLPPAPRRGGRRGTRGVRPCPARRGPEPRRPR